MIRKGLRGLGYFIGIALGVIYGEYLAIQTFFTAEICTGGRSVQCDWILNGWNPVLIGALFVIYLPFSPLVAMLQAWPAFVVSALLFWLAGLGEKKATKKTAAA